MKKLTALRSIPIRPNERATSLSAVTGGGREEDSVVAVHLGIPSAERGVGDEEGDRKGGMTGGLCDTIERPQDEEGGRPKDGIK